MTESKLVVFTAIIGQFPDRIRPPIYTPFDRDLDSQVDFVCISDLSAREIPKPWRVVAPLWHHSNPRRIARYHKIMAHELFPRAEYSLWCDASFQLLTDPWWMIGHYLQGADIAMYRHPQRKDAYAEARSIARLKKDNAKVVNQQISRYHKKGLPPKSGLMETGNVLRRHTAKIAHLNQAWWAEIQGGSLRDQLSLPYVIWQAQVPWAVLAGSGQEPVHCRYFKHIIRIK